MGVQAKLPTPNVPTGHFPNKPLPSAGTLPGSRVLSAA